MRPIDALSCLLELFDWCPSLSLILTLFFDLTLVLSLSVCRLSFSLFLSADFILSLYVCRLSFSLFLSADFRSLSFCLPPGCVSFRFYGCAPGFVSGGSLLIGRPILPPNLTSDPRAGDSVPRGFAVCCSADS